MNAIPEGQGASPASVTTLVTPERRLAFAFAKRHGVLVKRVVASHDVGKCRTENGGRKDEQTLPDPAPQAKRVEVFCSRLEFVERAERQPSQR